MTSSHAPSSTPSSRSVAECFSGQAVPDKVSVSFLPASTYFADRIIIITVAQDELGPEEVCLRVSMCVYVWGLGWVGAVLKGGYRFLSPTALSELGARR